MSILKTIALSTPAKPAYTKANENELDMDGGSGISHDRINDKIKNLSSSTKMKKSPETDFLTSGAKNAFRCLRKAFTKALIYRHFDPECHV